MFHHTNPWELDEALVAQGFVIGPCEAQDLIGLEQVLARQPQHAIPILPRMLAEGRMGKIGGVGYYRYPGGGGAIIDPLIEDLIREEAWFGKVTRSERSDQELAKEMIDVLRHTAQVLIRQGTPTDVINAALQRDVHFSAGFLGLGPGA